MERPSLSSSPGGRRRAAAVIAGASAAVAVAAGAGAATASPPTALRPLALGVQATSHALSEAAHGVASPAASPTPAATPAPTPTPPPPPPPLAVLTDPVHLTDVSAGRVGVPDVSADAGILIDVDRRTILWERSPDLPHAPASTTKELTAMVVMNNFKPDEVVTATPDALHQASDETRLGIAAGQSYTVQELLTAMLMVSANDAATTLAVDTVGMDRFVDAMNRQVQALGLRDSHFVTPVGLDDPQQMASARDLAVIGMEDMLHFPLLAQIVRTSHLVMGATAGHPAFTLDNLNRLVDGLYPPAVGIKPGWTGNAGPCLVSMAERGGHRLIAVLLNEKQHLYYDERALLEWGFAQYGLPNIPNLPEP